MRGFVGILMTSWRKEKAFESDLTGWKKDYQREGGQEGFLCWGNGKRRADSVLGSG